MARPPALLLLLVLGLCEYGHRVVHHRHREGLPPSPSTESKKLGSITHPRVGQQLELECVTTKEDSGAFWIRQDKDGSLHFIVFISSLSRATFNGNVRTSTRFEARKDGRVYRLVVKSFTREDEGNYFCLMNSNQVLYFSRGQPAFFPVPTTAAPTAPAPTTQRGITEKDPCLTTPDPETSKKKETNFFCEIFIWVPLAAACLLLLLALAVTITLCQ
ncbi:CD8A protein, partial [Glareola pratincola]|nr:CD8A protein [Glareola pratincola]